MTQDMYVLGVIPARGGSKRIPMKNIKPLAGVPLIGWMIRAAAEAGSLTRTIVSTDSPDIARVSLDMGGEVPFERPAEVSWDCPSELVAQHAVQFVENEIGREVDMVAFMQPTTPFCQPGDIDACVRMLAEHPEWDSVFSAMEIDQRPEWMFTVSKDGSGRLLMDGELRGDRGVVQALPELVMPNGAVYVTRRRALIEDGCIIAPKTGVHVMSHEDSVDIDVPFDFDLAQFVADRKIRSNGRFHPALRYADHT